MKKPENILLVYPKMPSETYWSFSHSMPLIGKKAAMPPLGLATLAGLESLKGYNLAIIDENIEKLTDKQLRWADMVFISSMMVQSDSMVDVAKRAKMQGKVVVAGGPYPIQYYDSADAESERCIDHFVLGEAEPVIAGQGGILDLFMNDFIAGKAKRAYSRSVFRSTGTARKVDESETERMMSYFVEDSDIQIVKDRPSMLNSPIPRFDLLKLNRYGSVTIQYSRACPHDCEFCNEGQLFGNKPRAKSNTQFIAELNQLFMMDYKGSVFIVDDNFIGDKSRVKEVLKSIKEFQSERGYPFTFFTEASIKMSEDTELMELMRDAGFNMVFVGIESPNKDALVAANKHFNAKVNLVDAVRKIQENGMEVTAGMIVGMDGEPDDICDQIYNFADEAGIPNLMVGLLQAARGSALYVRFAEEGRLLKDKILHGNNTHHFELGHVLDHGRDPGKLIADYKNLLSRLYDPSGKNYFARCRKMLDHIIPGETFTRKIRLQEVRTFGMSLLNQTFFRQYSREYRKFLAYSLMNKREVFPEAVRLAVIGHHFIEMTNNALNRY
jgi:radical SAM superfamily enzyme YgiQ (UPF0313 family)